MKIRYAAKTDVGMKRTHNEDYFSLIEDEQLFLVADGMGGHASGEVASKMAAETIGEFYQRTREDEDARGRAHRAGPRTRLRGRGGRARDARRRSLRDGPLRQQAARSGAGRG